MRPGNLLPLLCVALGCLITPGVVRAADGVVVIRGGTVMPAPGEVIENATIVVRDGLIEAVGGPDLPYPIGSEEVDASGLTVYAGFIDASASIGLDEVKRPAGPALGRFTDTRRSAAARTEATYRKGTAPELMAADFYQLDAKEAAGHHAAGFTAALVSPPSDIFAGQSALVSLSGAPRREAIIASPVAMHGAFSSRGRGYPGTLMGCMAHFRQVLSDAQRQAELERFHAQHPQKFRRPPYDPTLTALRPVLERGMPMVLRASSALGIDRVLGMGDEFALNVILDGSREAWRVAPALAEARTPVIVALGFEEEPKLEDEKSDDETEAADEAESGAGSDEGEPEKPSEEDEEPKSWEELPGKERFATPRRVKEDQHRKWRESVENAKVLADHGVVFVFGTQGKQKTFWKDLHVAMEHGLTSDVALRALTVAPATLFGVDGSLGTIEAGKAAHLTLVNGKLGDEKASVAYVFVDGAKFEVEGRKEAKAGADSGAEPTGPASLPGTWSVAVQSERGEIEMTWVLRKEGSGYAGKLETRFGEMELTQASLTGNAVKLIFETEFDGQPFSLSFTGKIGGDAGSGTGSSSMGESTWTATRTAKPKGGVR